MDIMQIKELAKERIEHIEFVSENTPNPKYPQLRVKLKSIFQLSISLERPRIWQVTDMLDKAAAYGIDFDERRIFWHTFARQDVVRYLVKDGKPTADFQNPPHCIIINGEPADFANALGHSDSALPKSPGQATPKYSETTSGGLNPDGTIKKWSIRHGSHCGFPGKIPNRVD